MVLDACEERRKEKLKTKAESREGERKREGRHFSFPRDVLGFTVLTGSERGDAVTRLRESISFSIIHISIEFSYNRSSMRGTTRVNFRLSIIINKNTIHIIIKNNNDIISEGKLILPRFGV